jgi:dTDP-4-dehydrorhamnose reductase
MRILILGGLGMLGHRLWIELSRQHDVWATVRGSSSDVPALPAIDRAHIRERVDVVDGDDLVRAVGCVRPEVIINCVGLVKQRATANDPVMAIKINALMPHQLADLCLASGCRLIHVSTDCVFSGQTGNYTESSRPDADDLYGRTKLLGEVTYPHTLTLRTSIIGRELANRQGLTEWFLAQNGHAKGYTRSLFSGITTHEFARVIADHVLPHPELSGLYHLASTPIAKYELLQLLKTSYKRDLNIEPDGAVICDRTLDSTRFRTDAGYVPRGWRDMVEEMASDQFEYDIVKRN